jgi:hypothetical protein
MFTTTIDGKTVELKAEDLTPNEGYAIITPDNVPKGYFNQDALNNIVKENVNKTKENYKNSLLEDKDFQKSILSRYNIQLDGEGKPVGLKPTVDVDEVKKNVTKELSAKYEEEKNNLTKVLENRNKAVIKNSIMSAVNGNWKVDWTEPFDNSEPMAVTQFMDKFIVDDNGNAVVKDTENGGIKFKGDGKPFTAKDYLLDEERFGKLFADKRQRSTNTAAGGGNGRKYSEEEVSKMSDAEYASNREEILKSM